MKQWVCALVFVLIVVSSGVAAPKGPEIDLVDNVLSINAEAIPLGRLLHLFDLATGMKSKVPPELANRNISVRFSGLNLTDGVKKIFQGQPLDYVLIQGQGIFITAASQLGGPESTPAYNQSPQPIDQQQPQFNQPFAQDFPQPAFGAPLQPGQQQQPATIQTPFGPIANPNAGRPIQPNAPLTTPGPQNSLFPATPGQPNVQPQLTPSIPGMQPGNPNPFGTANPFGTPAAPAPNPNSLFNTQGVQRTQ
jgi:hypothetical protein